MTFNGTWKVDRNENYEKFMEEMGEWTQTKLSIACELLDPRSNAARFFEFLSVSASVSHYL